MANQPQTTQTRPGRGGQERVQDQGTGDERDELDLGRAQEQQEEEAGDEELDDDDDLDDEDDLDEDDDEDEEA